MLSQKYFKPLLTLFFSLSLLFLNVTPVHAYVQFSLSSLTSDQIAYLNSTIHDLALESNSFIVWFNSENNNLYYTTNPDGISYTYPSNTVKYTNRSRMAYSGSIASYSNNGSFDFTTEVQMCLYFMYQGRLYVNMVWDDIGGSGSSNPLEMVNFNVLSKNSNMGLTSGSGTYVKGSTINFAAVPKEGYKLDHWESPSGYVYPSSMGNPSKITNVTSDMTIYAVFAPDDSSNYTDTDLNYTESVIRHYIDNRQLIYYDLKHSIDGTGTLYYTDINIDSSNSTISYYWYDDINIYFDHNCQGTITIYRNDVLYKKFYHYGSKFDLEITYNDYTSLQMYSNNYSFVYDLHIVPDVTDELQDIKYLISNGSDITNTSITENDSKIDDFNSTSGQLDDIESSYTSTISSNLESLSFSNDLLSDNKFINTANWVGSTFNDLIDNPLGLVLSFSLFVGLALLIMGKYL